MKLIKFTLITIATMCLFACSNSSVVSTEAPLKASLTDVEYRIGAGDLLAVNVWRNPELTMDVQVRPDGKISIPLVGDVLAAGKSANELKASLQEALVNFIRNPQVTIIVTNATSTDYQRRVRVTGGVMDPLSIPHRDGMTVLDLILEAGGTSEFAVDNKARLYRVEGGEVKAYSVKLGDILKKGKLDTNYKLMPSDIITVPERSF